MENRNKEQDNLTDRNVVPKAETPQTQKMEFNDDPKYHSLLSSNTFKKIGMQMENNGAGVTESYNH